MPGVQDLKSEQVSTRSEAESEGVSERAAVLEESLIVEGDGEANQQEADGEGHSEALSTEIEANGEGE